jgi:outer membrane lipoprotein-sorting protein
MKANIRIRFVVLLAVLSLSAGNVVAQKMSAVSPEHKDAYLRKIAETTGQMGTMECHFVQTQKLQALASAAKSEGFMLYKRPACMRWQYTSPTNYCFILNNGKAVMKRDGRSMRGEGTKAFARIGRMVLASISGRSVVDDKNFINTYQAGDGLFRITMVPRSATMRRVVNEIVMDFDQQSSFIKEIEMVGRKSVTSIVFSGKKVGVGIDDSQFKLSGK